MGSLAEFAPGTDFNGNSAKCSSRYVTRRNNVFRCISLFFRENVLSVRANYSVLISMLEDFQCRKGYTFSTLLGQLRDFCNKYESDNSKFFIRALLDINKKQSGVFETDYVQELAFLLWSEVGNFCDLFGHVCGKNSYVMASEDEGVRIARQKKSVDELVYFLKHGALCKFQIRSFEICGKEKVNYIRLIDYPLNYGESPLMSAARHRKPDVILALLRHGATIEQNWMCYKSALEVLLLAPNVIYLDTQDLLNIEIATQYFIRALTNVDKKHLDTLLEEGYSALHDSWQHLIPKTRSSQPCTLRQIAKVKIRSELNRHCQLPYGINQLPLPEILKECIDLLRD